LLAVAELRLHLRGGVVPPHALELRELRQRKLPVVRPGGDDDRARTHDLARRQLDGVRPAPADQPGRRACDRDAGAELLRLAERAAGEGLPGDTGRKAEVVLDLRARTRLPARRL